MCNSSVLLWGSGGDGSRVRNAGKKAMKHQDLGTLDDPIVLFGGPYSNLQATQALIARADGRPMICTGDVVAYCGAPARTVALVRAAGCPVVAGNCEIQLGNGAQDCGCGFEEGTACDLLSGSWYAFAQDHLSENDKTWMATLPDMISFQHSGARYAVIHGGVTDVARFIWSTSPEQVLLEEWRHVEDAIGPIDHIITGHSGIPFVTETPKGLWINAGVIGMPPHDGAPLTRFAVLEGGKVRIEALDYDAAGAAADMEHAKLPAGYRDGLLSGYWPSEEVLPSDLRIFASASG